MFSKLWIQNFQKIDNQIDIPLSRMTVLVGENGSGKSSVLKALHWAVRCANLSDDRGKVTIEQMDFVPSRDYADLPHKLKLQNSKNGRKITVGLQDDKIGRVEFEIGAASNNAGVNVAAKGLAKRLLVHPENITSAYIPGIAGVAEEETIQAIPIMHRKAASGEGGAVLRQIMLSTLAPGLEGTGENYKKLEELSRWVGKVMPGVELWAKYDRIRDKLIHVKFLTPDMVVHGQKKSVSWKSIEMAGTGFLQVVQLFSYIIYFKPRVLLIDEPDAHLHPGRQRKLVRALSEILEEYVDTQVVITTHSPALVTALPQDSAIHWIDNGKLRANGDLVRKRMGWSALDKELILFTEDGNTDLIAKLLSQWPDIESRVLIWPVFGKNGLPDGGKVKKLRELMDVKILLHRDRDFMSDADCDDWRRLKHYDIHDVGVWFTDGYDIESIACHPEYFSTVLDVDAAIVDEIFADALSSFNAKEVQTEFSNAYIAAVNSLAAKAGRDPIARWYALGGFGWRTIKGKLAYKALCRSCVNVLPKHGMARKIGNRNKLLSDWNEYVLGQSLYEAIVNIRD